jgi:very-short-patch-repair endonuclease
MLVGTTRTDSLDPGEATRYRRHLQLKDYRWRNYARRTEAEAALYRIAQRVLLERVRRQVVLGRYIADLVVPERMLVVEVDGPIHRRQLSYDERRDAYLRDHGFRVVRFPNEQILSDPISVAVRLRGFSCLPDYQRCWRAAMRRME